jgi:hypothetical protein
MYWARHLIRWGHHELAPTVIARGQAAYAAGRIEASDIRYHIDLCKLELIVARREGYDAEAASKTAHSQIHTFSELADVREELLASIEQLATNFGMANSLMPLLQDEWKQLMLDKRRKEPPAGTDEMIQRVEAIMNKLSDQYINPFMARAVADMANKLPFNKSEQ